MVVGIGIAYEPAVVVAKRDGCPGLVSYFVRVGLCEVRDQMCREYSPIEHGDKSKEAESKNRKKAKCSTKGAFLVLWH